MCLGVVASDGRTMLLEGFENGSVGSDIYLKVLKEEVLLWIEQNYKVSVWGSLCLTVR